MKRSRRNIEDPSEFADYGAHLKGLGHTQLQHPRGLRGSTFGPASPGRRLSRDEREAVARQMRKDGKI